MSTIVFRAPTDADMHCIKSWLQQEEDEFGHSFICNWNIIERSRERGEMLAFIKDLRPVAFLVDGRAGPDIISVHPEHRRQGLATAIMNVATDRARERGNSLIEVDCVTPESARLFRKLGYFGPELESEGAGYGSTKAWKRLARNLPLPVGDNIPVSIRLYPPIRGWKEDVSPYFEKLITGRIDRDGVIRLPHRVDFFVDDHGDSADDNVVEIMIDGELLFRDKVKRERAREIGLQRDAGYVWYIESVTRTQAIEAAE